MSAVLEVVLGLSFLFFVLSLICSALNEAVASVLALRAEMLDRGVQHLLGGKTEAARFYRQPLIRSLYRKRKPSYIPSNRFALTAIDLYAPDVLRGVSQPSFSAGAPAGVQQVFELLLLEAKGDADAFKKNVEQWFDDAMDRVSGWYRRRAQVMLAVLGLAVTAALNVNAVGITQRLWTDAPLRSAIAEGAATVSTTPPGSVPAPDPLQRLDAEYRRLGASKLPVGWSKENRQSPWWVAVLGWGITILAVSMGAPFWFDVLTRAARLRRSGEKPDDDGP